MNKTQAGAKAKRLFGKHGFARRERLEKDMTCFVGIRNVGLLLGGFRMTTMQIGWGKTWEDAFADFDKRHREKEQKTKKKAAADFKWKFADDLAKEFYAMIHKKEKAHA